MKDFYAILGIPTDSDAGAVHEAYRQAAQQYHPDKVRHLAAEFQELAETRMRDINEAYDVLRDTEKRRAYDENRRPQKDPQRTEPAESAPQTPAPTGAKSSNAFWIALSVLVVIGLVGVAGVRWAQSRRESAVVARAQATVIFRDARDAFDNQRWEDAIVLLQQVTEVRPEWLDAWDLRWRAEITLALYRDAAASLERAIALDPTSPELRGAHARSTFMLGDVEGTRAELIWLRKNGETQRVAALLDQFRLQDADLASNLNMGLDRQPRTGESVTALPRGVDLNPQFAAWEIPVRSQGNRPTCSAFAVIGALEFAVARHRRSGVHLSVQFLNWAARRATDRTADGGFFWELWRGFDEHGVCEEPLMPYEATSDRSLEPGPAALRGAARLKALGQKLQWIKEWDIDTGLTVEQLELVKRTLAAGVPVYGGLRWPKEPEWTGSVLHMCEPHEVFDGHSVLLSGYRDEPSHSGGGLFLIRNSGGPERHGAFPHAYARTYMNDAAWIEPTLAPVR